MTVLELSYSWVKANMQFCLCEISRKKPRKFNEIMNKNKISIGLKRVSSTFFATCACGYKSKKTFCKSLKILCVQFVHSQFNTYILILKFNFITMRIFSWFESISINQHEDIKEKIFQNSYWAQINHIQLFYNYDLKSAFILKAV